MITINPPVVMPYAPAAQPIAFASPMLMRDEVNGNRLTLQFTSTPTVAGDTLDQDLARRSLPILQTNFGITGTV